MGKKKLLAFICMVALCVGFAVAQVITIKHTVDRGETLASIAKRYSTTEAKIVELNPDAAQFIYVGMELIIPATSHTVDETKAVQTQDKAVARTNTADERSALSAAVIAQDDDKTGSDFEKVGIVYTSSYGFIPKPKKVEGVHGSNWTLRFTIGANYNFTKSFYIGAQIGYAALESTMSMSGGAGKYTQMNTTSHLITLPIETGYKLHVVPGKFAIVPYTGIDVNCVVKSKVEIKSGSDKEKKSIKPEHRFGVNGRLGARLSICGFNIGGSYVLSWDKNFGENDGFPEISIGFGF